MQSNRTSEASPEASSFEKPTESSPSEFSSPEFSSFESGSQTSFSLSSSDLQQDPADSPVAALSPAERASQGGHIFFKSEQGLLYLHLPTSKTVTVEWSHIWEQLQQRLESSQRIWPSNTPVYLVAHDRLLDQRQLDQLALALSQAHLTLRRVLTSRRQTAIAAVTSGYSVDQQSPALTLAAAPAAKFALPPDSVLAEPLYLETTLRSGGEVRHPGSVVVVGDTNPGSAIIADGDILVWGRLRGVAHAGAHGDRDRQIMALHMEPTQLRIADQVARAPAKAQNQVYAEVAYISSDGIQIMKATDFSQAKRHF
jgi:septum site-determining protein MinC